MPGFDGSGPRGQGPMTGGGYGKCLPGERFFGRRVRRGRRGLSAGRGQAWGAGSVLADSAGENPGNDRLGRMESMLEEIGRRLSRRETPGE